MAGAAPGGSSSPEARKQQREESAMQWNFRLVTPKIEEVLEGEEMRSAYPGATLTVPERICKTDDPASCMAHALHLRGGGPQVCALCDATTRVVRANPGMFPKGSAKLVTGKRQTQLKTAYKCEACNVYLHETCSYMWHSMDLIHKPEDVGAPHDSEYAEECTRWEMWLNRQASHKDKHWLSADSITVPRAVSLTVIGIRFNKTADLVKSVKYAPVDAVASLHGKQEDFSNIFDAVQAISPHTKRLKALNGGVSHKLTKSGRGEVDAVQDHLLRMALGGAAAGEAGAAAGERPQPAECALCEITHRFWTGAHKKGLEKVRKTAQKCVECGVFLHSSCHDQWHKAWTPISHKIVSEKADLQHVRDARDVDQIEMEYLVACFLLAGAPEQEDGAGADGAADGAAAPPGDGGKLSKARTVVQIVQKDLQWTDDERLALDEEALAKHWCVPSVHTRIKRGHGQLSRVQGTKQPCLLCDMTLTALKYAHGEAALEFANGAVPDIKCEYECKDCTLAMKERAETAHKPAIAGAPEVYLHAECANEWHNAFVPYSKLVQKSVRVLLT